MDDPVIILNFLENACNIQLQRVRYEIIELVLSFCTLMTTLEDQIDEFFKNTHRNNSTRANNQRILILSRAVIVLKSIRFEIKDRRTLNSLPNSAQQTGINYHDMAIFCQKISQAKEQEVQQRLVTLPEINVSKFDGNNYD